MVNGMEFEYIDENINEIVNNRENVLCLKPGAVGKKIALFAYMCEEPGVYKRIQLTKEQSKMIFPFEPIFWFDRERERFSLEDYISIRNLSAFNLKKLNGFASKIDDNNLFYKVGIYAIFNDGAATNALITTKKNFEKTGGINTFNEVFDDFKEDIQDYTIIEENKVEENKYVIPELQQLSNSQPIVRSLKK